MVSHIAEKSMMHQVASPGDHQLLPAKLAIQKMKNHMVSIIHGTNPSFPTKQLDHLLPQAVETLKMVCRSHLNPRLSAYMQLWGAFDFNKTPSLRLDVKWSSTSDYMRGEPGRTIVFCDII